jgi:hypothetical protein
MIRATTRSRRRISAGNGAPQPADRPGEPARTAGKDLPPPASHDNGPGATAPPEHAPRQTPRQCPQNRSDQMSLRRSRADPLPDARRASVKRQHWPALLSQLCPAIRRIMNRPDTKRRTAAQSAASCQHPPRRLPTLPPDQGHDSGPTGPRPILRDECVSGPTDTPRAADAHG